LQDCLVCAETRRAGYVLCKLPCGHTVRAQIVDNGNVRFESSSPAVASPRNLKSNHSDAASQFQGVAPLDRTLNSTFPDSPQRSRSIDTVSVNVVNSPLQKTTASHHIASPSTRQLTPRPMLRRGTSVSANPGPPRNAVGPLDVDLLTRKGPGQPGPTTLCTPLVSVRGERTTGRPRDVHTCVDPTPAAEARKASLSQANIPDVHDCDSNVLHKLCNVTLLMACGEDSKVEHLRVRGTLVGTYSDQSDVGPRLDNPDEIQVIVTYVDASARSLPLLFPGQKARTFRDTETPEGNLIKWRASLCRMGKKFGDVDEPRDDGAPS